MLSVADCVAIRDRPEDVAAAARSFASRKVVRLLERVSLPPFVAAHTLLGRHPEIEVADLGLVVLSAWEPGVPDWLPTHDGTLAGFGQAIARLNELVTPTTFLAGHPNNLLCQIAVSTGQHGPNFHLIGDARAGLEALDLISSLLALELAPAVLLVAFDTPLEHTLSSPEATDSDAVALLFVGEPTAGRADLEVITVAPPVGARAVDVLDELARGLLDAVEPSGVVEGPTGPLLRYSITSGDQPRKG
jgi:hypothetical protein